MQVHYNGPRLPWHNTRVTEGAALPDNVPCTKKGAHQSALFRCCNNPLQSTALTMSSTTFLASPKTIMVLSR